MLNVLKLFIDDVLSTVVKPLDERDNHVEGKIVLVGRDIQNLQWENSLLQTIYSRP